ncbi:MAG: branched-chain amino acid transaminase [Gammaproteobacteria bacterium]|nr:branched-chain amino acid transaminase [Gammaproteobacteria bacterium]
MNPVNDFADRDGWIWLDGQWCPWREAKIHLCTHTLHYGLGVFEGVRAYPSDRGALIFRLADHTRRLFESAQIVNLPMPFTVAEINQAQKDIIVRNELNSAYIRPIAFYGSQEMGLHASSLKVHVAVIAWEWGTYLGDESIRLGIRVKTSSYCRQHANATMCRAKVNGHYVNSMMALSEAVGDGYDEALMLDCDGYCAEGSGENIFCVRDGVLYTPSTQNILPGITRDTIIKLAQARGVEVVEKRITRDELYTADEIFLTGTAAEVTPVRELDRRPIRDGVPGELTLSLQKSYFDLVHGRLDQYASWLSAAEPDGSLPRAQAL